VPPEGYDFGGIPLERTAHAALRIRNAGGYPLIVDSLSVGPLQFTLEDTLALPVSIAPDSFLAAQMSFFTDTTLVAAGSLVVVTNDRETPALVIPLVGHGIDAVANMYPDSIGATVFEYDTASAQLEFTNTGEGAYAYYVRVEEPLALASSEGQSGPIRPSRLSHDVVRTSETPEKFLPRSGESQGVGLSSAGAVDWVSIPDTTGWVPGFDTLAVEIGLDAGTVGPGVYDATLVVLTSDADLDSVNVPLQLRVPQMRFVDHDNAAFLATVTDEGVFGFYDASQSETYGTGFVYPASGGENYLFHGSLWVGNDTSRVSDASYDYDFEVVSGGSVSIGGTHPQRSNCGFSDVGSVSALGVEVDQDGLSLDSPSFDDFLFLEYAVRNVSDSLLSSVYIGLYLDWDIRDARSNAGAYDAARVTGYMYDAAAIDSTHVGVVMVDPSSCSAFHLVHHPTYVYPYGTLRDRDKYDLLSDGVVDSTTWEAEDWSMVMSAGPFDLAPGDTANVSFAIVAGDDKDALLANAATARGLATGIATTTSGQPRLRLEQSYPNPFNPKTRIEFEIPQPAYTQLCVYNVRGQLVTRLVDRELTAGLHHVVWDGRNASGSYVSSGVYFYRLAVAGLPSLTKKMVLLK
jgi:hypothetical protein